MFKMSTYKSTDPESVLYVPTGSSVSQRKNQTTGKLVHGDTTLSTADSSLEKQFLDDVPVTLYYY